MKAGNSFNTLMSHKGSSSRFYLLDEESTSKESISSNSTSYQEPGFPLNRLTASRSSSVANIPITNLDEFNNNEKLDKLMKFVTESAQSYSYTLMSTNSMALRLKVLKRSLEILLENHDLLNSSLQTIPYDYQMPPSFDRKASSSTLQSLLSSRVTSNQNKLSKFDSSTNLTLLNGSQSFTVNKSLLKDLREFVDMLEKGVESDISVDQKNTIMKLHNLSLSSVDQSSNSKTRRDELKRQLFHALAMPFIEQQSIIPKPPVLTDNELEIQSQSSVRQIHSSATGKTQSPKAILTINSHSPWEIININDIGLLMFGITNACLHHTKLIDLIAPRSRDLVYRRLQRSSDLVFSGEVIAVKRDNMSIAWTSLWAKRINDRIYMIFEQINCDIIDVVIEKTTDDVDGYIVQNVLQQSGELYKQSLKNFNLKYFLPSVSKALGYNHHGMISEDESYKDSNNINKIRYFTLATENNEFIPCALTSEPLLELEDNITRNSNILSLIRIDLHALPYIAGSFVISAKTHRIMSFNEAIAKNLFGRGSLQDSLINIILPGFDHLLKIAETENPNMMIQEGLILPEHYFRKLNAWKKIIDSDEREDLFLKSRGINGIHNDGNPLLVDVQLRVAQSYVYVLWITFSRSPNANTQNSINGSKNMPSQLHLRDMDKDASGEFVRQDSVKSNYKESNNSVKSSPMTPKISSSSTISGSSSWEYESQPTTAKSTGELLEIEEDHLTDLKHTCPHFPKDIGAERRSKTVYDFINLKDLGSGAYGKVWLARHKKDKDYEVCIKSIVKERILVDTWVRDRKLGTIPSEIQILYTIAKNPHGNLLRLVDYFEDGDYYHLETLPIPDTIDLYDLIELKKDSMNERECAYIFYQLCSALKQLHKMGIIHRDIKDENIIIDKNYSVKLIDFGSSAFIRDGPFKVFLGTLEYASPEVLDGSLYEGKKQDVWAVGVLLFTLIFKENPFLQVDEILDAKVNFPTHTEVSDLCVDLIKMILVEEPNDRPEIEEILNHEWLKGFK